MKSAVDYLRDNNFDVSTGLLFTCKDYDFILGGFESIVIHKGKKNREEKLTKSNILSRIKDLHYLHTKAPPSSANDIIDLEAVEEIFQKENI